MPTTKTIRIRVETGAGSTKYLCRSEGKVALVSSGYTHESISNLSPYAKHGRHAAEIVFALEDAEVQAFTWCRDEASGIARAWREGREFGHNVTAVWAEAV